MTEDRRVKHEYVCWLSRNNRKQDYLKTVEEPPSLSTPDKQAENVQSDA